jgi:hypothetical protein
MQPSYVIVFNYGSLKDVLTYEIIRILSNDVTVTE